MTSIRRFALLVLSMPLVLVLGGCGGTQTPTGEAPDGDPAMAPGEGIAPADVPSVGTLGVTAQPDGIVYIDGERTEHRTPVRELEIEPGDREVQVRFDGTEALSEPRLVRVRGGVNTNVFFRDRSDQVDDAEHEVDGQEAQPTDGAGAESDPLDEAEPGDSEATGGEAE